MNSYLNVEYFYTKIFGCYYYTVKILKNINFFHVFPFKKQKSNVKLKIRSKSMKIRKLLFGVGLKHLDYIKIELEWSKSFISVSLFLSDIEHLLRIAGIKFSSNFGS